MIFIGATFCNADKAPGFKQTITKMREFVSSQASARHYHLATIGVALDWTVRDGLDFVRAFGDFDEVMVGRNWLNEGAIKYIWRDVVGDPKVPQIVIVLREVKVGDRAINVGMETLLLRKMGVDEITEWVNNGAPLPRD
ncbi:MAG TPA: hypothetical protein VEK86_04730 [Gemmatimonadales bacterium]|nr:hypothetical protein [Gemmatimonadales bacterium]